MVRRQRNATPGMGRAPYNPMAGEYAGLYTEGIYPFCAMMQVAAEDTYDEYVICRGVDLRILKFIDYEEGNQDKPGISVAKPFGSRLKGCCQIGQVYPAFLPTQGTIGGRPKSSAYVPPLPTDVDWRIGQNPGTAADAPDAYLGHPEDLEDSITMLTDHNDEYVNWMFIGGGSSQAIRLAVVTESGGISMDDSGEVTLYNSDTSATTTTVTAYFNWAEGGSGDLNENDEVFVAYFPIESRWRIIGRECP